MVRGPPGRERDWVSPEVVEDFAETQKAGHYRIRDSSLWKVCERAKSKFTSKGIQGILDANLCFCVE